MSKHISSLRKDAAQRKIEKKIKVLESYVRKGIPDNAFIPENEVAFRLWEDADLGVEKIGSPNTMIKPHNFALKQRVAELIKELIQRNRKKQRRASVVETLQIENKENTRLIKDLTSQYHETRYKLGQCQQSERRLKTRNVELIEENADLVRQLNVVTGLQPVPNKGK